jgi:site-specific recombinase XerD
MFDVLFTYPKTRARHQTGPGVAERERYLTHCVSQGLARETLLRIACELLVVAERLDVTGGNQITRREVEEAARNWVRHQRRRGRTGRGEWSGRLFMQVAIGWLRFLELLAMAPDGPQTIHSDQVDDFVAYLRDERGLSPRTVSHRRWQVEHFLRHVPSAKASIADMTVDDVDAFLGSKGRDGWCRVSIATSAAALRSFFRHAEMRGWCASGIAAAIDAPRLFKEEGLSRGPQWVDVQRLLAGTGGDAPRDMRDHAILMLFAIYGLRSGEVRGLRLEDLDWTRELIMVERPKQRRTQYYPLVASVGDAILRYLQAVRPRCTSREVFVTIKAPFRPLSAGGMYHAVASRLNALGIHTGHHGPHSLRHACATHLVEEGLSLKEIGDHLGHRGAHATRTYAKVDLVGLREVAAFDLGELS